MTKVAVFLTLFISYLGYSLLVYTRGTESPVVVPRAEQEEVAKGKLLFQQYNCIACHQVYGLGGYLGPELTTAWSDKNRGEQYMRAILASGGSRMPNFHLPAHEIESLLSYLKYIDATARPIKDK
jgi:nitric oxide reductase subunit C